MSARETFNFWNNSNDYYKHLGDDLTPLYANPGLKRLLDNVKDGMYVLDVGCGEGTKLSHIAKEKKTLCHGIDISKTAISQGMKKHKKVKLSVQNIESIKYKKNMFDLTYSAYVFEHTKNPKKILTEMLRVTKKGGKIIIVCPNFGSPLYPSPVTPKVKHFLRCILRDIRYIFKKPQNLEWYPETPILDPKKWQPDFDTTILPYAYSLKITYSGSIASSSWRGSPAGGSLTLKLIRLPSKILGLLGVFPFKWWGPTLYFELVK